MNNNDLITELQAEAIATKKHLKHISLDTDYFTDADPSILGTDTATYSRYCKNVRKEYSIYPDLIYKPGRRKVVQHFLDMDRIYKTGHFYNKLESQAKLNLKAELEQL